jgi:hypothetical protein
MMTPLYHSAASNPQINTTPHTLSSHAKSTHETDLIPRLAQHEPELGRDNIISISPKGTESYTMQP